jgi:hypothetical protein
MAVTLDTLLAARRSPAPLCIAAERRRSVEDRIPTGTVGTSWSGERPAMSKVSAIGQGRPFHLKTVSMQKFELVFTY